MTSLNLDTLETAEILSARLYGAQLRLRDAREAVDALPVRLGSPWPSGRVEACAELRAAQDAVDAAAIALFDATDR